MKWAVEMNISSLVKRHKEVIDMFRDKNAKLKDQNSSMQRVFKMILEELGKLSQEAKGDLKRKKRGKNTGEERDKTKEKKKH